MSHDKVISFLICHRDTGVELLSLIKSVPKFEIFLRRLSKPVATFAEDSCIRLILCEEDSKLFLVLLLSRLVIISTV